MAENERAAVVKWLRTKLTPCGYHYANAKMFADAIERGDHLPHPKVPKGCAYRPALMIRRLRNYFRVWRRRGAARLDHGLWLHWAIFGRYP